jgi:acid phosphatase
MTRPTDLSTRLLLAWILLGSSIFLPARNCNAQSQASTPPSQTHAQIEKVPNLYRIKQVLISYHDCSCSCGCYQNEIDQVAGEAQSYLEKRLAHTTQQAGKLAIVLDIDDTALSDYDFLQSIDFGYRTDLFNAWVSQERGAPIAAVLRLFNFAVQNKVAVFFVTGRPESQRQATVDNLEKAGYHGWTDLFMKSDNFHPRRISRFKSPVRHTIAAKGYTIVINLGDQRSDLEGEGAELSLKLPNPFYYIR